MEQTQIDNIVNGNSVLAADMTADIDLGGIRAGTVFTAGTSLESIWRQAVGFPVEVQNFTFDSYTEFVEAGVNLVVNSFSWTNQGTPTNLTITDSDGQLVSQSVSGTK